MSGKEPVDYYRLFISDHIIDKVLETNQYGDQYMESHQDHLATTQGQASWRSSTRTRVRKPDHVVSCSI